MQGNNSYRDAVRYGHKTLIIGTSMVEGLRMKELNKYLTNSFSKRRSFSGAKIRQLFSYYSVRSLVDETPNIILSHRGCNNIPNKTSTPEKIANDICIH